MPRNTREEIKALNKKYSTNKPQVSDEGKRETQSDRDRHAKADAEDRKANREPRWMVAHEGTKERKEQDKKKAEFNKDLRHGRYGKAGRFSHEAIKDKKERERSKKRYDAQMSRTGSERLNITDDFREKYKKATEAERANMIDDISAGTGTYQGGGKYSRNVSDFEKIQSLRASGRQADKRSGGRAVTDANTVARTTGIPQTQGVKPSIAEQRATQSKPSSNMFSADEAKAVQDYYKEHPDEVDQNVLDEVNKALGQGQQPAQPEQPVQPTEQEQKKARADEYRNKLNAMIDAQRQAQQAKLSGAKQEQVQALQRRAEELGIQADQAKTQASVQTAQTERGLEEQLATSGLQRGGTAEQRRLALGTAKSERLGGITQQEMTGQRQLSQEEQNVERRYQDSIAQLDAQTAQMKQQAFMGAEQMEQQANQFEESKRQFDETLNFKRQALSEDARRFDVGLASDMKKFYDGLSVQQGQFDAQMKQETERFNAQMSAQQDALDKDYQFKYDQLNANLAISDQQREDRKAELDKQYALESQKINQDLLKFNANQEQSMQQFLAQMGAKYDQMAQQANQFDANLAEKIRADKANTALGYSKLSQAERLANQKKTETASVEKTVKPYQTQITNLRKEATQYNTAPLASGAGKRDANAEITAYIKSLYDGKRINDEQADYLLSINGL